MSLKKICNWLNVVVACFFSASTALAQPVVTYFHNDISGSPIVATDAVGNVVWKESYRPYGDKLRNEPASGNGSNKIGYAGSPFDAGTGLSYMGARYYDPVIGRFMGVDPVGFQEDNIHSFNRYAYANNNPYKYIDKNGKYAELVFEAMSLTAGFNSLINNMRSGNYGAAVVDGGGIFADVIGAALPGVPGVAGLGIKASREAAETAVKHGTVGGERSGKSFTRAGKNEVKSENSIAHSGQTTCNGCGQSTVPSKQSQSGVTPPGNETHVDHIIPKSKGGDGSPSNGQVLCRDCNLSKSNN